MGIRAIEYRPWKGTRTDPNQRWLVISKHVFDKNIRAKAVLVLLILGMMLAHAFPIIGAILVPHEEITNEDMVGSDEEPAGPESNYTVTEGNLDVTGDLRFDGTFTINGTMSLNYQEIPEDEKNITQEEMNQTLGDGRVWVQGSIFGLGALGGLRGTTTQTGLIYVEGMVTVTGFLRIGAFPELPPTNFTDNSSMSGFPFPPGGLPENITDMLALLDLLQFATTVAGNGNITGNGTVTGNGTIVGEVASEGEEEISFTGGQGYLTSGLLIIFTMLLAAIVCADVIADDLANSSFVLYFSRPVRSLDYLLGKSVGLMWVMWVFCLIPPVAYVLVMIGTQSGDEYIGGLKILGLTMVAGFVTSLYYLPYGLMISSFTKSKAYAGIGIFMSFFVLSIVSELFSGNNVHWMLIDPFQLLSGFYNILFGGSLPDGIAGWQVGASMSAFIIVPAIITYLWVQRKGVGK